MKMLLVSLVLLVPHKNLIQTKPRNSPKQPSAQPTNVLRVKTDKILEKLHIGDTCYVNNNNLPLRSRPVASSPAAAYLLRDAKIIVREVLPNQWVLVDYFNLDVGVDGYVPRQCVSRTKSH